MGHFILEGNKVRSSRARRRRSKWAVGFGSVGEKKKKKRNAWMSKRGLEHSRARLCHTVHRHDLLTHWALYLLWLAEPLFLEVAHTRGGPQRTIQCHQIQKCRRLYTVLSGFFYLMSALLPLVSLMCQIRVVCKYGYNQPEAATLSSYCVHSGRHENKSVYHPSEYCMPLWCRVLAFGIHPTICLFLPKVFITWYIWW